MVPASRYTTNTSAWTGPSTAKSKTGRGLVGSAPEDGRCVIMNGMAQIVVTCECGLEVRGETDEVVEQVQAHGRDAHNMDVTREQVLAMAKPADGS